MWRFKLFRFKPLGTTPARLPADEHIAMPGKLRVRQLDDLHDKERVLLETLAGQLCLHRHLGKDLHTSKSGKLLDGEQAGLLN